MWRQGSGGHPAVPLTKALVLGGAGGEAVVALTRVAAPRVEAAPILTDPRLGLTFILICVV